MAIASWSSARPIHTKIVTGESCHAYDRLRHTDISRVQGGVPQVVGPLLSQVGPMFELKL